MRQRKTNAIWSHFYVKSENIQTNKLIDLENRLRLGREGVGKTGKSSEKVQTSSPGDIMNSIVTIVNNTVLHIWKLLREQTIKVSS